jgi:hypothetical protein
VAGEPGESAVTDDLGFRDDAPAGEMPAPPPVENVDDPLWAAIMGTAGTGKTTLARLDADTCDDVILCATTGIAAVNIGACTINSLLWYYDTADLRTQYEVGKLNVALRKIADSGFRRIYLDEVSMMDGRQLDILCLALDQLNETRAGRDEAPLGMTLIGDFAQLPPVNAPFVFERPAWKRFEAGMITLTEPRRQADASFVAALQAVRRGDIGHALAYFSTRIQPYEQRDFNGTTILAKNDEVDRYNAVRMLELTTPEHEYLAKRTGQGDPAWKHIPEKLILKPGALVMILANRREKVDGLEPHEWPMIYANGDLGIYLGQDGGGRARVELHRGGEVTVQSVTRQRTKATGNKGVKVAREDVLGSITYTPVRVAYASTCHRSQGLSLDNVQVMFHSHFWTQPSMLYVAMSRARTPEGLRLVGNVKQFEKRIVVDPKIRRWL